MGPLQECVCCKGMSAITALNWTRCMSLWENVAFSGPFVPTSKLCPLRALWVPVAFVPNWNLDPSLERPVCCLSGPNKSELGHLKDLWQTLFVEVGLSNLNFQSATWDSSIGPGGSRMVSPPVHFPKLILWLPLSNEYPLWGSPECKYMHILLTHADVPTTMKTFKSRRCVLLEQQHSHIYIYIFIYFILFLSKCFSWIRLIQIWLCVLMLKIDYSKCNLSPNSSLHVRIFNKLCKMKLFIQT